MEKESTVNMQHVTDFHSSHSVLKKNKVPGISNSRQNFMRQCLYIIILRL